MSPPTPVIALLHHLRGAELPAPRDLRVCEGGAAAPTSASRSSAASSRRLGTWIEALAPSKPAAVPSWSPRNACLIRYVAGAARARPLLQHRRREGREPGNGRRIARGTRVD